MSTTDKYSAVVESGSCDQSYTYWDERRNCGHRHKTLEAAEECGRKLQNWSADGRSCSADWYNYTIHNQNEERVDR